MIPIKSLLRTAVLIASRNGLIKKTRLTEFNITQEAIIAVNPEDNDEVLETRLLMVRRRSFSPPMTAS